MAPHTPQRSSRPGEPVALLDHAPPTPPQRSSRPGEPVALLDHAPPTPPSARRAPAKPWRASITGRWLKSHHLVGPRGGLAEASHRVSGQPRVDLVQAQIDLAVGEREEAAPRAVARSEEHTSELQSRENL